MSPVPVDMLQQLGLALGVLKRNGDGIELNNDWLARPGDFLGSVLRDPTQREAAIALARSVLGELDGELADALGAEDESWISLVETDATPSAGLFAVFGTPQEDAGPLLLSLAFKFATPSDNGNAGGSAVARLPLVALDALPDGSGGSITPARLLPGTPEGAISAIASVDIPANGNDGIVLRQAALKATVPTVEDENPSFSIALKGLLLPGANEARDLVFDTADADFSEAFQILLSLAAQGGDSILNDVLALFGLVPGGPLPALEPRELFERGTAAISDRFAALLDDPTASRALADTAARLVGLDADDVAGSGTVADPFTLRLGSSGGGHLDLTLANQRDAATNSVAFTPSIRALWPAEEGFVGGEAELFSLSLGPEPSFTPLTRLLAFARAGGDGQPLLQTEVSGRPLRIGHLDVGIALDESFRPTVVLAAGDVSLAGIDYPVLDLRSADVVAELAEGAGAAVTDRLAAALGDGAAGRALAAAAGLAPPPGVTSAQWADLVPVGELIADPIGAIARYHARVFGGDEVATRAVAAFATVLGVVPAEVDGTGTEADPWRARLASASDGGPVTELVVWQDATPRRLHVGLGLAAELELGEIPVALAGRAGLISLTLPNGTTGSAPGLEWGGRQELALRLREPITLGAPDRGVRIGGLDLIVERTAAAGLKASLAVRDPVIRQPGEDAPLPDLVVHPDGSVEPEDLSASVWDALGELAGDRLAALGSPGLEHLAAFLGWGKDVAAVSLPDVGVSVALGSDGLPRLEPGALLSNPVAAVRDWGADVLASAPATLHVAARLAAISRKASFDPVAIALPEATVTASALARVALGGNGGASLGLTSGSSLGLDALADVKSALLQRTEGSVEAAMDALAAAAALAPRLERLARGRDLRALVDALRELADSDGLVPAAAQAPAGWQRRTIAAGHLGAPAVVDVSEVIPGVPPERCIFVACDLPGVAPWPGQAAERVVDLTAPGIDPATLDLTSAPSNGPWFVLIPRRAESSSGAAVTLEDQAARIERAIGALAARLPEGDTAVALIAHSVAGFAAVAAAGGATAVSHLVTVATPHGGAALERLDAASAQDGLAFARALAFDLEDEGTAATLVELVAAGSRAGDPATGRAGAGTIAEEFVPPASLPDAPQAQRIAVVASVGVDAIEQGVTELVRATMGRALGDEDRLRAPDSLGIDVAFPLDLPEPGSLRLAGELRLGAADLLARGEDVMPSAAIGIHLEAHGTQGWLIPPGVGGAPALRYAELDLVLDGGVGSSTLRLHDAHLYGVHRPQLEIRLGEPEGASDFDAFARTVLGALAGAVGPLPDDGPERAAVEIAARLGLVTLGPEGVAASPTGVERFLAAPGTVVHQALSTELGDLLTQLFPAPRAGGGIRIAGSDEIDVLLDPVARSVTAATRPEGVAVADLGRAEFEIALDERGIGGRVVLAPLVAGPLGPTRVRLDFAPQSAPEFALERFGDTIRIAPDPDEQALKRTALSLVAGAFASSVLDELRDDAEERVTPLLEAAGLASETANPRRLWLDPAAFVAHIGPWLSQVAATQGDGPVSRARQLLDAVRALLDVDGRDGEIELPWDLTLAASERDGRALVTLARDATSASEGVRAGGSLSFTLAPDAPPIPELRATLSLAEPGEGFDAVTLEAALQREPSATVRLEPSSGSDILLPLLPDSSVMGLVEQGATAILPLVLDALAGHATLGPGVTALGDALQLRSDGSFDATRLRAAGSDPGAHLAGVLGGSAAAARATFEAIARLLRTVVGSGRVSVQEAGSRLRFEIADPVVLVLNATGELVAELTDVVRSGLRLSLRAEATGTSSPAIESFRAEVAVEDPEIVRVLGIAVFPFLTVQTTGAEPSVEVGLWNSTDADREAVLARVGGDAPGIVLRDHEGTDRDDPATVGAAVARLWLMPLAADVVLALQPVEQLLQREIAALGESIEELLLGGGILVPHSPEVGLDPDFIDAPLPRLLALAARAAGSLSPIAIIEGLGMGPQSGERDGSTFVGIRFTIDQRVEVSLPGDLVIALETETGWLDGQEGGLDLLLLSVPVGDDAGARIRPWVRARGIGARIGGAGGDKLFDLGVSVRSVAIHGHYEAIADAGSGEMAVERSGVHVVVNDLALPLARAAGGDNPVANKVLGQSRESGTELAPAFSPELILRSDPASMELRAGAGNPPWWLPVQRSFGPLYVEQVGLNVTSTGEGAERRLAFVTVLMDGGVSIAGMSMAVDDLALTIPADSPFTLEAWSVDLAGLAVAYDSSGVKIAGGLRKIARAGGVEYAGVLEIRFAQFGLTAVGSYGEFPQPSPPAGGPQTYSSFFVFAALDYPIGGPPAFFVTGLGAGIGLNRRLVLPQETTQVTSHTLVRAMDPSSGFASDPMSGLERMANDFPPEPGTFWLALGVRFTSFVLVESIAVLSAEVGGQGLEIGLLGLSRMDLPSRDFVMARIELALRARFSTREALIGVQGQLTDNSWLIHSSCRLTGGFAFYVWFEEGDFVLTLGGYHPRFNRPARYPDVPRLGYNWSVSNAITIKGESYFAITASSVMAGGSFEASYDAGIAWAAFRMGWNALISWDPFYYDFEVYVSVSAGVKIRVCAPFGLGCATISISLSLGASVHVWGPELRGRATLDLDVTSVTVAFGATEDANSKSPLTWTAFHEKYLVAGDPDGATMAVTVARGYVPINAEAGETPGAGSADDPWRVLPEFTFVTQTRSASNRLEVAGGVADLNGEAIDLGPMDKADVVSHHRVSVTGAEGPVAGLPFVAATGMVPEAIWGIVHTDDAPAARVRPAYVGSSVDVAARIETAETATAKLEDVERSKTAHPLPFHQEFVWRADFQEHAAAALAYMDSQPTTTTEILDKATTKLAALQDPLARVAYAMDVAAPPRIAPLSEGLFPAIPAPVPTEPEPETPPPAEADIRAGRPRLESVLRLSPATSASGVLRTTVSTAPEVARVAPPTLAQMQVGDAPISARLSLRTRSAVQFDRTVAAMGVPVFTARAGGVREARRSLLSDPATAGSLRELESQLERGIELLGGDMVVLTVPNASLDADPIRPVMAVTGDQQVRVVMLDRAGDVLSDATGSSLEAVVPRGAYRILVAGLGSAGTARAGGSAGWHTGAQLVQMTSDVYVGSDAIVRATSPETKRSRRAVTSAIVTGADAVAFADLVETTLPPVMTTLIVGLENVGAIDEALQDLALSLSGAQRIVVDGGPEAPRVIASGNRVYAVFAIAPEPGAGAVVATVAAGATWELIGVGGSVAPVEEIARVLAERGIDGSIPALVAYAGGSSSVTWRHEEA